MKSMVGLGLGVVMLLASAGLAGADQSDVALFDGTNPANQPGAGAICGSAASFTWHLAVANWGGDGVVRITFKDGDILRFPIKAGATLALSQAGGKGAGSAVRVSSEGGPAQLAGSLSAIGGGNPRCASCDAVSEGGIGDAACDNVIAN